MSTIDSSANGANEVLATRRIQVLLAPPLTRPLGGHRPLAEATARIGGVTLIELYAEYPDFQIDIDQEQARLLAHDVIVFQHPLYLSLPKTQSGVG